MNLFCVMTLTAVSLALPLRASGSMKQKLVKIGDPVVLTCKISLHYEIFWVKVSIMEKPRLLMVTRLKNNGKLTEVLNYNTTHYQGCLVEYFFGLKLFSVLISDLGSYYCGIVEGKRIEFEDGVHIYADIKDEKLFSNREANYTLPPLTEEREILHPIFVTVLGVGLLVMVLVVYIVHMMTSGNINRNIKT